MRVKPHEPLWDIGCDHGWLGIHALKQGLVPAVSFVDPALGSIDKLQGNLPEDLLEKTTIYYAHGETLPWEQVTGTVVILGMGFRSIRKIFEQATSRPLKGLRFLISPHSEEGLAIDFFAPHRPAVSYIEENGRQRLLLEININES